MKNCCCGVCCFLGVLCVAIVLCCTCFVVKNCSIAINSVLLVVMIILSVIVLAVIVAICIYFCSVASVKKKKIEKLAEVDSFIKKNNDQTTNVNNPSDENILKLIRIYCDTLADI